MPFHEAAVFRVSFTTAYHALVQKGRLTPGEIVFVMGASGAIGSSAVQTAKALGALVIAHASTDAKRRFALECGADAVIDGSSDSWRKELAAVTNGRQADIVVDPVGGAASARAFRSLAYNGRHLVIGFASGKIADLPLNLPILKSAAALGVNIYEFGRREPEVAANNLSRLLELYEARALRPIVGASFSLERFAEAMQAVIDGMVHGRVVLNIGRPDFLESGSRDQLPTLRR
jgi:NADPH2:quinone reductase